MTIQLHRLEGFYWVAKEGGYAAAARNFPYPITQPGVHNQVKKLETDLGVSLFQRVGKDALSLTGSGQVLYDFCKPFFEGLPLAIEDALGAKGILRIAAGELETSYFLPNWINELRTRNPALQIRLKETRGLDLADLRNGRSDLIIDYVDDLPKDCEAIAIGEHHLFAVCSAQLPTIDNPVTLVSEHDFITFSEGSRERRFQLGGLASAGIKPTLGGSASSVAGILGLVEAGLGVSVIPWPSKDGPCRAGVRQLPLDLGERYPISAIFLKSRTEEAVLQSVLAL